MFAATAFVAAAHAQSSAVWRLPLTAFLAGDRREENSWGAF